MIQKLNETDDTAQTTEITETTKTADAASTLETPESCLTVDTTDIWPCFRSQRPTITAVRQTQNLTEPSIEFPYVAWMPYMVAGTALFCFVLIFLICFFQAIRDYCCCWKKEMSEHSSRASPGTIHSKSASRSNSLDQIQTRAPVIPPSVVPARVTMQAPVRPPRYITDGIKSARKMQSNQPMSAPPGTKQLARTVKIIGDILTTRGSNKRRR